ncbi:MAG: GtrA family protein [Prevotellaceae bacterium]|nr:GtrA family protein [Prevotellaceae bacterium]
MKPSPTLLAFARFVLVGTVATAVHYAVYYLLQPFINVNVAYTAGYALSFVLNFYLTAYFTFGKAPSWARAFGFGGAHLINYLLHLVLLNLFLWMGLSKPWAPLPVFAVAIPVNFLLVRFVFTRKK